jgi:hypothetical protein
MRNIQEEEKIYFIENNVSKGPRLKLPLRLGTAIEQLFLERAWTPDAALNLYVA